MTVERDKRLRAALDAAGDAVLVTDASGAIVEGNLAIARLNGLERDAMIGRSLLEIAVEMGAGEEELDGIRAAIAGEEVTYHACRHTRRGERVSVGVTVTQLPDGDGAVFVTQGLEVHRRQRFQTAHARVLAEAAEVLATPGDLETTLAGLAEIVVPEWADGMIVALTGADGVLAAAAVHAAEPGFAGPLPDGLLGDVVARGEPILVRETSDAELRNAGYGSLVLVPLWAHGEPIGALGVATGLAGRPFGERDLGLFTAIGERTAQAVLAARLEEGRRRAEHRFHAAFDSAPIGITITRADEDGVMRFVEVNAAMAAILGYAAAELIGRPTALVTHPDDRPGEEHRIRQLAEGAPETSGEKRIVRPGGEVRWVHIHGAPIGDGTVVAQVQDITERRKFESELEYLASHDALTGVLNRRSFEEALDSALAHVRRHGDAAAILTLDVDNFKHVNDTYGHAAGDAVLRAAAEALQQRLRATDRIGRLGGDEFGVVLSRTDATAARAVARELLDGLRDLRVPVGDRVVRVTASAGLRSLEPDETGDPGTLLSEADMAMYDAKERGRDRLVAVRPGDLQPERIRARIRWSERIRDALEGEGFVLYEQPIMRLDDDVVDRHELLLRLVEGGRGGVDVIEPVDFLGVAERTGQIQAIDRWVVREAIALLAARQAAGDERALEVNLSGDSISDPSVVDFIVAQVQHAAVDPARLIFEVTETSAIGNLEQARDLAERLTDLGCGFALDDFGAGFGSFAYLKHLPLGIIKIDGQFVRGLRSSHADQVTVRAIVDVARALGKETVAEFVEDGETLQLLRELGVDRAQGFHIGRPAAVRVPAPAPRRRGRAGAPR